MPASEAGGGGSSPPGSTHYGTHRERTLSPGSRYQTRGFPALRPVSLRHDRYVTTKRSYRPLLLVSYRAIHCAIVVEHLMVHYIDNQF